MTEKKIPFSLDRVREIAKTYPSPFYIYDEVAIIENISALKKAFAWADFKEYFAVKATPNPFLMKLLKLFPHVQKHLCLLHFPLHCQKKLYSHKDTCYPLLHQL